MYKKTAKASYRKVLKNNEYAPVFAGTAIKLTNANSMPVVRSIKQKKKFVPDPSVKTKDLDRCAQDGRQQDLAIYMQEIASLGRPTVEEWNKL